MRVKKTIKWMGIGLLVLFGFAISFLAVVIYDPNLFFKDANQKIERLLNRQSVIAVSLENFDGNYRKGYSFSKITLGTPDQPLAVVYGLHLKPIVMPLLRRKFQATEVSIDSLQIYTDRASQFSHLTDRSANSTQYQAEITRLSIGKSDLIRPDGVIEAGFQGLVRWNNDLLVHFTSSWVKLSKSSPTMHLPVGTARFNGRGLQLAGCQLNTETERGLLQTWLDGSVLKTPTNEAWQYDFRGAVKLAGDSLSVTEFRGTYQEPLLVTESSHIQYNDANVDWHGHYHLVDRDWEITTDWQNMKLPESLLPLRFHGHTRLFGENLQERIDLAFQINNLTYHEFSFDSLSGHLALANDTLFTETGVYFSTLGCTGFVDSLLLRTPTDLWCSASLELRDFNPSSFLKSCPEISLDGEMSMKYNRSNSWQKVAGDLNLKSLSMGIAGLDGGKFRYKGEIDSEQVMRGDVSGTLHGVKLGGFIFDTSQVHIILDRETVRVAEFSGRAINGNSIHGMGEISLQMDYIDVDSLYGQLRGLALNSSGFLVYRDGNRFMFEQSQFTVGDGTVTFSGDYLNPRDYQFWAQLNQFSVADINEFFGWSHRFQGTVDGETYLSRSGTVPIITAHLNIADGHYDGVTFQTLSSEFTYRNQRLVISELQLISELGGAVFSAVIPFQSDAIGGLKVSPTLPVDIEGTFMEFEIQPLIRYMPWSSHTAGKADGKLKYTGSFSEPYIQVDLDVNNPEFDRIGGSKLTGQLIYEDGQLYCKSISLTTAQGNYTISGVIPADLSMPVASRRSVIDDPINLLITGQSSDFELLLPYFSQLDSLYGTLHAQMSITGSIRHPVRNGELIVREATLSMLPLENSIKNINGRLTVDDNLLTLHQMSALSRGEIVDDSYIQRIRESFRRLFGRESEPDIKPNIQLSGTMDMTEFFHPKMDIRLKGEDLFLDSAEDLFLAIGQADISIAGQDTIHITGEFIPNPYELVITSDFVTAEDLSVRKNQQAIVTEYDIHIPLYNVAKLENNFADLEIEGDVNISASSAEGSHYSGNVNIIDGSFYLNGNEYTQTEGTILLDPLSEFPTVDVEAVTNIADKSFRVFYEGSIDNVNIEIIPEDPGQYYSEDELLRLLLTREEGLAVNGGATIDEAGKNILSNYVESELARFIAQNSPVDRFQLQSDGALLTDIGNADINLYVGKQLTRRLTMSIRSDVFANQIANEYEVVYRLNRNSFLIARLDEDGLPHLNYRIKLKY